jgi:transposase
MSRDFLSHRLLSSVSRDFFKPLGRTSVALYIDCADRLAEAGGDSGRISQTDAIALIRETLQAHPNIRLEEDEGASLRDARQRAGQIFTRLCEAGWMEDQQLSLHERFAVVAPGLRPLLRLLRELAEDEIAELTTFADTVRGVCETLEREDVLNPRIRTPDELRATITDLNSRLENAVIQLHGVEKLISMFDQRQRSSESPAETLRLLYAEFGSGQHMVCYDALRRNGLLPRLLAVRTKVADIRDQPLVKEYLTEGLVAHYGWSSDDAYIRAEKALRDLERRLVSIRAVADAIDARMAGFNRLSQQRYAYQTELRGRRPEIIKSYCDAINAAHTGTRLGMLRDTEPDFAPMIPEMKCFFGIESLSRTRRSRAAADLTFGELGEEQFAEEDTIAQMRERQRLALTPQRAARLVAGLLGKIGKQAGTDEFNAESLDDMLDLLATAAYDHATIADGSRVRWNVTGPRLDLGLDPEKILTDAQAGWQMERFTITRQS